MITKRPFGKDETGREMTLFTMTNRTGASVSVTDFGGHLVNIRVPDREGRLGEVNLGFDELAPYLESHGSIGATIGRYANRIGGCRFSLNGKTYQVPDNENGNCLHGGIKNFQFRWFQAETVEDEREDAVLLTYVSHDGEEGFPGKVRLQVTFAFDEKNTLTIRYLATTDQDTVINLTNHAYFNLGCRENILDQEVIIHTDLVTETDDQLIPTGNIISVAGTPLDLREGGTVRAGLAQRANCHPIDNANGYDINYCVPGEGMREMAVVTDKETGRRMRVYSDQPGIQFYSGQGLHHTGHQGAVYGPYGGLALETQHYADSPNHPNFPSTVLKAGESFRSVTRYSFETI